MVSLDPNWLDSFSSHVICHGLRITVCVTIQVKNVEGIAKSRLIFASAYNVDCEMSSSK